MRVLQAVSILALAAAPIGASAAPPLIRPFAPPFVAPHAGAPRPIFWRHVGGDGGIERRHHHGFFGPIGPIVATTGEAAPLAIEPTPSPFVVAAPVFVSVTVGPQRESTVEAQQGWADGPRLIEIGRQAPRHGRLPLIVYGD